MVKILETLTIMSILLAIGGVDGYMYGTTSLTAPILLFMIGILGAYGTYREGGFRSYEMDVDDSDVDALLRAERKRRRAAARKSKRNYLL